MPRGEVAQVLHNLLVKLTPTTTTTAATTTTTTTEPATTTTTTVATATFENLGGFHYLKPSVVCWGSNRIDIVTLGEG